MHAPAVNTRVTLLYYVACCAWQSTKQGRAACLCAASDRCLATIYYRGYLDEIDVAGLL
jgi:hypothetical protein